MPTKHSRRSKPDRRGDKARSRGQRQQYQQQQRRWHEERAQRRYQVPSQREPQKRVSPVWSSWLGGGNKKRPHSPPSAHEYARDLALEGVRNSELQILERLRVRSPWRPLLGRSRILHPLSEEQFFDVYFGRQAFVLRRGPAFPLPMQASSAAGLLRSLRIGVNANVIASRTLREHSPDARENLHREYGRPALAAFARSQPVRLHGIERKRPRLLVHERFLAHFARSAPGRGVGVNLYWAPSNVAALPAEDAHYEQLIVQLYGARKWVICKRGMRAPAHLLAEAVPTGNHNVLQKDNLLDGSCTQVMLRRGDVLHIPSRSWHWTTRGPGASAHLSFGVVPPIMADVVALAPSARAFLDRLGPQAALAQPLPLWRYNDTDSAVPEIVRLCERLPWPSGRVSASANWSDIEVVVPTAVCSVTAVRAVVHRLFGTLRRPALHPGGAYPSEGRKPDIEYGSFRRKSRTWAIWIAEWLGTIGLIAFLCWGCYALASDPEDEEARRARRKNERASQHWNRKARANEKYRYDKYD